MIKCSNIYIIGISEGEGKEWNTNNIRRHKITNMRNKMGYIPTEIIDV